MKFQNEILHEEYHAMMGTNEWQKINSKAIYVWKTTGMIVSSVFFLITLLLFLFSYLYDWPLLIPIGMAAIMLFLAVLLIFILPKIRLKIWRFMILEDEVCLQYGILVITQMLIPMARVQNVSTKQGPLLRRYQLATVSISTAAGVHDIPALSLEQAKELRDKIIKLAGVQDDV
ncbi:hypothetical protein CUC15_01100 [Oceanobacillus zhaokaii]|uniref:YdbS-like PH domain-containing protein n=1 Tax=Oceanobacillus zhaokaii TaxID=2052660 RepID=A0A345PCE3_9BACI|nr:PH domain-containing protein [Oceanobacillus zhaokaii]AXI07673.1 hypothetical protein CUC15_01100 [Oceanobacillus zhaokaii]